MQGDICLYMFREDSWIWEQATERKGGGARVLSGVYFCLGRLAGSGFGYIRGDRPGRGAAGFQGLLLKEGVDMQVLLWKGRAGAVLVDTRQMQILLIRESGGEQQASRVSFGKERGQQLSRFSFARIVGMAEAKQVILWEWGEGQQESRFFFVEGRGSMHAGSPLWG